MALDLPQLALQPSRIYPQRSWGWHELSLVLAGNSIATSVSAAQNYNTYAFQNTAADADSFSQTLMMKKGTYTFFALGVTSTNAGIIDWTINGSSIVSGQDWYSGSTVVNVVNTTTSVSIPKNGDQLIVGTVNGKNASSSSYFIFLTMFGFIPTSEAAELRP